MLLEEFVASGLGAKITREAIVYAGDYENTTSEIKLLNFRNPQQLM